LRFENKNAVRVLSILGCLAAVIFISFFINKEHEQQIETEEQLRAEAEARALSFELEEEEKQRALLYTPESIGSLIEGAGVGNLLEPLIGREDYIASAAGVSAYGYTNLGIANVTNHLNIREEASEGGKLVGKMSRNAACEILGYEGEWVHIKSGDVEGYCHSDYLLIGEMAALRASQIITKEAESTSGGLRVREQPNTDCEILTTMGEGERLEVVEDEKDGWIKVMVDDQEGYISAEYAEVKEELMTAMTMTELMYGDGVSNVRVDLCQFAKKFIGNPYVWGGTSLTKGADCSGFVLSVFKQYGYSLPHSSRAQAGMGKKISLAEAKPGDLVFYSGGGRINHVAIYIGGGQVVHASNPRTGIRISAATYRTVSTVRRIIND